MSEPFSSVLITSTVRRPPERHTISVAPTSKRIPISCVGARSNVINRTRT